MERTTDASSESSVRELRVIDGVFCVAVLVLVSGGAMVGVGLTQNQNDFVAGGALAFAIACVVMCLVVVFIFRRN